MEKKQLDWKDIRYTVRYWLINEAVMGFETYSISSEGYFKQVYGESKEFKVLSYERKDGKGGLDTVENLDEAQKFMSGSIKWDGCSNIQFDEQESCMLHFCGKEGATDIGVLLGKLYDLAESEIPNAEFC